MNYCPTYRSFLARRRTVTAVLLACGLATGCASDFSLNKNPNPPLRSMHSPQDGASTLTQFRSDAELRRYLRRWIPAPPRRRGGRNPEEIPETVLITGSLIRGPSITNTQEAGVDEGDIVKLHGDVLVILRRGRLFTVSLAGGRMVPVDAIDAYAPGVNPDGDWYDEMLIVDDRISIIGYSYARGGTQLNRFRIDHDGHLRFEDAYQIGSSDYYSLNNYASRLVGDHLVFYFPAFFPYQSRDPLEILPSFRRWDGTGQEAPFRRAATARDVFIPTKFLNRPDVHIDTLHSLMSCDLAAPVLDCKTTSVLGPASRNFYVSENAVYIWVTGYVDGLSGDLASVGSFLFRMPLDGVRPAAIGTRGAPTDQFSFREDMADRTLNVLVREDGVGDGFWGYLYSSGAVALLRLPLEKLDAGLEDTDVDDYRPLPTPLAAHDLFRNRFVGDYVLYGTGNDYGRPRTRNPVLFAAPVRERRRTTYSDNPEEAAFEIPLDHAVDRIEIMGRDAVVIGGDETSLHFSTIDLSSAAEPVAGDRYVFSDASQAETRSHAFFFRPDPVDMGPGTESGTSGVLGLPVARAAREAYKNLFEDSAAIVFLRRAEKRFSPLGELPAHDEDAADDACKASCYDWYGNARPIFIGERVFALLGYELVEARLEGSSLREVARVSIAAKRDATKP